MAAFADPEIDGIFARAAGGVRRSCCRYLDAELIRANPKVFVGYSDHTSLHCWLRERGGSGDVLWADGGCGFCA